MKKITEETVFNLIDGNLSDAEASDVLKELRGYPEEEALYRSLLMTEGYIKASAVEKTQSDFTMRVTKKVDFLIRKKKRNGILYSALSIVGFFTVSSMIGAVLLFDNTELPVGGSTVEINWMLTFWNEIGGSITFLSGTAIQNLFFLLIAFTFFVAMDRVLMNRFHWRQ